MTPTPAGWGAMNQVLAYKHDIVGKSFTIGPAGSVCSAAATQTWTVGANTCSAPLLQTASGQSSTVSNTASGYTGSATFACTGTTWGSATAATCAPVPSGCPAVAAQPWAVGTATCSAALTATASGGSSTVSNTASGFTGSATFACTGTTWGAATSPSCTTAPVNPPCTSVTRSWTVSGNTCSGNVPANARRWIRHGDQHDCGRDGFGDLRLLGLDLR